MTMRTSFRSLLFVALIALPLSSFAQAADDDGPRKLKTDAVKPIVVPFELLESRHMAVQVKVNGKGPYRLVFDTGAPMNLVTNKLAKDSGLLDAKSKKGGGFFGSRGGVTIKTLEIGDAKIENVPTQVMDHPTVAAIAEVVGPLEGIIGFPFFSRYKMTVDYQKKELTLIPNGYEPGDYMEELTAKLMTMQGKKGSEPKIVAAAGVWGLVVTKDAADEEAGVVIEKIHAGGAAATAGLKPGDRLLTIDGRWTDTVGDTFVAASLVKPGREVSVVIIRDGKEMKLKVKPAKGV